jgi:REP element-mobilizing transposase RayT
MARKLRVQIPGAIYLLTSRGDRSEDVFRDDEDRHAFLKTLEGACQKTAWQVHAYCLLPNHFHLVVETPQPNLVSGMKWFLGTYTARFNRRHSLTGHVFAGRYKSQLVAPDDDYFQQACDYVHLNPWRANLLSPNTPLEEFPWSSYSVYVQPAQRPPWVRTDRLLPEQEMADSRGEFARRLDALRSQNLGEQNRKLRARWCIGSLEFQREILERIDAEGWIGAHHFGPEIHQAAEAKASRIIDEELARILWTEAELLRKQKGDPVKLRIAQRLRAETTVTMQWIAARLQMGTKGYLSHLLYWQRQADKENVTPIEAKAMRRRPGGDVSTEVGLAAHETREKTIITIL